MTNLTLEASQSFDILMDRYNRKEEVDEFHKSTAIAAFTLMTQHASLRRAASMLVDRAMLRGWTVLASSADATRRAHANAADAFATLIIDILAEVNQAHGVEPGSYARDAARAFNQSTVAFTHQASMVEAEHEAEAE